MIKQDLSVIRDKINEIDSNLIELFEERYRLTDEVGRVKAMTKKPVNVPEREREIYKKVSEKLYIGDMAIPIWKTIIRLAKSREYDICFNEVIGSEFGDLIKDSYKGIEEITKGKKPVLAVELERPSDVIYFLEFLYDEGFYPVELKISACQCTCLLDILEDVDVDEKSFITTLYKLCNEFKYVRFLGWEP